MRWTWKNTIQQNNRSGRGPWCDEPRSDNPLIMKISEIIIYGPNRQSLSLGSENWILMTPWWRGHRHIHFQPPKGRDRSDLLSRNIQKQKIWHRKRQTTNVKQQWQECSLMRGLYGNVRRSEMQFDSKSIKKNVFWLICISPNWRILRCSNQPD